MLIWLIVVLEWSVVLEWVGGSGATSTAPGSVVQLPRGASSSLLFKIVLVPMTAFRN